MNIVSKEYMEKIDKYIDEKGFNEGQNGAMKALIKEIVLFAHLYQEAAKKDVEEILKNISYRNIRDIARSAKDSNTDYVNLAKMMLYHTKESIMKAIYIIRNVLLEEEEVDDL